MSTTATKPRASVSRKAPTTAQCNAAGWPRPYADYTPLFAQEVAGRLPVPWNSGARALADDFTNSRKIGEQFAIEISARDCLCEVCGEPMTGPIVMGKRHLRREDDEAGRLTVDGYGTHPRCMLLTLKFCPHYAKADLNADDVVAYLHEDVDQHRAWARHQSRRGYPKYVPPIEGSRPLTTSDVRELARQQRGQET